MPVPSNLSLQLGDCLRLLSRIEDRSIDFVLSDPPYGITDCAWDKPIDPVKLWAQYQRLLKPNSAIALFAQQPFATAIAAAAPPRWLRYDWIWDKAYCTGAGNAKRRPMRRHENILIFAPAPPRYRVSGLKACARTKVRQSKSEAYRGFRTGAHVTLKTGYPQSILRYSSRPAGELVAPCAKPVGLLEFLIRTYTTPCGVVLDNAMGLGSTGVAAVRARRRFIGMELDRARFQIARRRIRAEACL